ncbi:right-handed parallel beta-helix repeat-containing protein [Butyrivibrio sp. AE3006]|uniref:right-handed parallel beta-helix repeat-containing protein n=1 Tax=Butyrivibrio sp. AE3006 TaxID=1280673 RepID=UPI0004122C2E|nr:right-handed parallel beta-helix repeat-containing protein [Butyrivibrio sp. AE3006]
MKRIVALILTGLLVISPCDGVCSIQAKATDSYGQDLDDENRDTDIVTENPQAETMQTSGEEGAPESEDEAAGDANDTGSSDEAADTGDEQESQGQDESASDSSSENESASDSAGQEEDGEEPAPSSEEPATGEETPETDTEDNTAAESDVNQDETSEDAQASDNAEEQPNAEETEKNTEETADEEPAELQSDAFDYSTEIDGFTINISADENVLPNGTTVSVKSVEKVNNKDIDKILEKIIDGSVLGSASFDITFKDADGKEVQPVEGSSVNLHFEISREMETLYEYSVDPQIKVMHIDDEAKADELESETNVVSEGEIIQAMSDEDLEELREDAQEVADAANEDIEYENADDANADEDIEEVEEIEETDEESSGEEIPVSEDSLADINADYQEETPEPVEDNTGYEYKEPDELEVEVKADSFSVYSVVLANGYDPSAFLNASTHTYTFSSGDLNEGNFQGMVQAALDQSRNDINNTYTIILPAGSYPVKVNSLYISSNTIIDMTAGTTIYGADGYLNLLSGDWRVETGLASLGSLAGFDAYKNITIKGGTWDGCGRNKSGSGTCMIRFAHVDGLTFDGVTFKDAYDSHHVEVAATRNFLVKDCTFRDYTDKGSSLEAIQLDVSHSAENFIWKNGVYDDLACENVEITGCTFENLIRGLGSHHSVVGNYYSNVNIHDNTFTNIKGTAIVARNFKDSQIQNNTLVNVGTGIDFRQTEGSLYLKNGSSSVSKGALEYSCNCVISGNDIGLVETNSDIKTGIRYGGFEVKKGTNNLPKGEINIGGFTITSNNIHGTMERGISAMYCSSATVSDNTIEGMKGSNCVGLYLGTVSGQVITGNTIKGRDTGNILSVTDSCSIDEISGNTLIGGVVGLFVKKNSTVKLIADNCIYGARKMAVQVQTKCTVKKTSNNLCASVNSKFKGKRSVYIDKTSKAAFYSDGKITLGKGEKFEPYLLTSEKGKVSVKSSKKKIAAASKSEIKGKKKGNAVITATQNKMKGLMSVTVGTAPKSVSVPEATVNLSVGDVYLLQPQVNSGAGCGRYGFKSSKKNSVYVTPQGAILAKKKGTSTITITTYNKKKCKVKVVVN